MERPQFWGINHLKLAATDLHKTKDFYVDVMGMEYLPEYDHYNKQHELFAFMLKMRHNGDEVLVEVRKNPAQAEKQKFWDPITFGVRSRDDLEAVRRWMEQNSIRHSQVFTGLKGWLTCALDPDDKIVRIYADESHEWTTDFDVDDFWLR